MRRLWVATALALVVALAAVIASAAHLTVRGGTIQVFTFPVDLGPIPASVDIDPDTLNPDSQGNHVMAYIELPDGYDVGDIEVETVTLRVEGEVDSVDAESAPTEVGDHDEDGIPDLMVKFNRQAVLDLIADKTGDVTFVVSGQLSGGELFEGSDTIDPPVPATTAPMPTPITSEPAPEPTPTAAPEPTPTPAPISTPGPAPTPSPEPSPTPTPVPTQSPEPSPEPTSTPEPEPTADPEPSPEPTSTPEA